jgi:DNA-binding NtrC family response regulator
MILVIDDEVHIREVVRDSLDFVGIATLTAATGADGLALLASHRDEIEVVLLDLRMPGMDGRETLRRLRALAPHLPVILASGIGDLGLTDELAGDARVLPLAKPFALDSLVDTIQRARTLAID